MQPVSARDALEYATRDEWLKLYAVFVGGAALTLLAPLVPPPVGFLLVVVAVGVVLVTTVAGAHKLLAESGGVRAGGGV